MSSSIPYNWSPRSYQRPFFEAVSAGYKRLYAVMPRRSGKSLMFLNLAVWYAAKYPNSLIWFVGPYANQTRRIFWTRQFIWDHIPPELIERSNENEMSLTLTNGSTLMVLGGDNVDKLVGAGPNFIVLTEWALHSPATWDLLRPILVQNNGIACFDTTPRGYANHAYNLFQIASRRPETWFVRWLRQKDLKRDARGEDGGPVISQTDIQEAIDEGMDPALVAQEFNAEWEGYATGTFYGPQMSALEKNGRLSVVPWNPERETFIAADLGMSDDTAIIFGQMDASGIVSVIDYIQDSGRSLQSYVSEISQKPYKIRHTYWPHDLRQRDYLSGVSRESYLKSLGLWDVRIVPNVGVGDGIDKVRALLRSENVRIDAERCRRLVDALVGYRRRWDAKARAYSSSPVHDQFSHGADAMRYFALACEEERVYSGNLKVKSSYECNDNPFGEINEEELRRRWYASADGPVRSQYPRELGDRIEDTRGDYRTVPRDPEDR